MYRYRYHTVFRNTYGRTQGHMSSPAFRDHCNLKSRQCLHRQRHVLKKLATNINIQLLVSYSSLYVEGDRYGSWTTRSNSKCGERSYARKRAKFSHRLLKEITFFNSRRNYDICVVQHHGGRGLCHSLRDWQNFRATNSWRSNDA